MNTPRLHGLDALRAFALLLGIVFHGLLGFVAGFPWLVTDRFSSPVAAAFTFWAHSFRMALFMLIAGYFARLSLGRRTTASFIRDRLKRIGLPLVAFWPFVVFSLGPIALLAGALSPDRAPIAPEAPADPLLLVTPGQLWFLWSLLQCYALVLVARALARRFAPVATSRLVAGAGRVLSGPGAPVLGALTMFAGMLANGVPGAVAGPTTLRPELGATFAFFGAFAIGWALNAHPDALTRLTRGWGVRLVIAVALTAGVLAASGLSMTAPTEPTARDWLLGAVYALAAWEWIHGLLGAALALLHTERPAVRYLADASYWMYLVHLPLVTLGAALVAGLAWPIGVKLLVILGIPLALTLLSYDLLVRSTWLGRWLNGKAHPSVLRGSRAARVPHRVGTR